MIIYEDKNKEKIDKESIIELEQKNVRKHWNPETRMICDALLVFFEVIVGLLATYFSERLFKFLVITPWVLVIFSLCRILVYVL